MSDLFWRDENGRLCCDIEDVIAAKEIVDEFNRKDLSEIDVRADGKKVDIRDDRLWQFRITGLLNLDYFLFFDEEWKMNYDE